MLKSSDCKKPMERDLWENLGVDGRILKYPCAQLNTRP
jgi:hypothetical protein